jgi:two-component system, chemotaxis family, protein-glutamate methylesterase/glutaminase
VTAPSPAAGAAKRIRVLTIDDSVVARRVLSHIIAGFPDLELVGQGVNGQEAVDMAAELRPDVITMDIRMPVLDGYEATRRIMTETPTPIVLVSAHEPHEVQGSFKALEAGAVTVLPKPTGPGTPTYQSAATELVTTLRTVAGLRLVTRRKRPSETVPATSPTRSTPPGAPPQDHTIDLVAIGASTGGPAALGRILREIPSDFPVPILIVQHIADGFDEGLVRWLDTVTPMKVRMGEHDMRLAPGEVIVAPNGVHMGVSSRNRITLVAGEPIGAHRPAVSYMFETVARAFGRRALGAILTGIGRDGTDGLAELHAAGGRVIAQDEASCVVYGMPKAAFEAGVTDQVVPLDRVAGVITAAVAQGRRLTAS